MFIEPYNGDSLLMNQQEQELINEKLYTPDNAEITRLDSPLVIKIENKYYKVYGNEEVPAETVLIPEEELEEELSVNTASVEEVLLPTTDTNIQYIL